jgi:hypothetical protein
MERAVVRQILGDPGVLPRIARHVRADGFVDPIVKTVMASALAYFAATGEAPTAVAILQEVKEAAAKGVKGPTVVDVADAIEAAREAGGVASDYVVKKILGAERDRALFAALERSNKMYAAGKRDEIFAEIERARSIGAVDVALGQDHGATLAQRTAYRLKYKAPIRWGTGIFELDDITDGGLSVDNPLGCVLAPPKAGKSLFLDHVAIHHQTIGGFAVYFSFENGEREVLSRHDAAISMVPIKYVYARAEEVERKVGAFLARTKGGMHVKQFPRGGQTCCRDLDAYLMELRARQDVRPTVIIFDYWDEMKANDPEKYDGRHNELEAIGHEMAALCQKHGCVGWTASREKADASEKKKAGRSAHDVAGAYAKANVVDLLVAILRSDEEKLDSKVRFQVIASRFSAESAPTAALPSAYECGRIVVQHAAPELGPVT